MMSPVKLMIATALLAVAASAATLRKSQAPAVEVPAEMEAVEGSTSTSGGGGGGSVTVAFYEDPTCSTAVTSINVSECFNITVGGSQVLCFVRFEAALPASRPASAGIITVTGISQRVSLHKPLR